MTVRGFVMKGNNMTITCDWCTWETYGPFGVVLAARLHTHKQTCRNRPRTDTT